LTYCALTLSMAETNEGVLPLGAARNSGNYVAAL
jgi:hypothetical protein